MLKLQAVGEIEIDSPVGDLLLSFLYFGGKDMDGGMVDGRG